MDAKSMPGVSMRVLAKSEGPMPGYETVVTELNVPAGTAVGRHSHPGLETTYVVAGEAELFIDGQPGRRIGPGEAFQVPPHVVHRVTIGAKDAKACSTLVVEAGKPLVIAALS